MIQKAEAPKRKRGRPRKPVEPIILSGWKCPQCGRVLSPDVRECNHKSNSFLKPANFRTDIFSRNF